MHAVVGAAGGGRLQRLGSASARGSHSAEWSLAMASLLSRPGRSVCSWKAANTSCDWRWGSHGCLAEAPIAQYGGGGTKAEQGLEAVPGGAGAVGGGDGADETGHD